MPLKHQRRYWTLSTDGNRTPIEVIETIEDSTPMPESHQQIQQYVSIPQAANSAPMQAMPATPIAQSAPSSMFRPRQPNPVPFFAGAVGLFLAFYSWSAAGEVESLKRKNDFLAQQVVTLQAQNEALKEMAAIVR